MKWAGVTQSIQRLATGCTVRESNPGGCEIFPTRPDWPKGSPNLLYNAYRISFLGANRLGSGDKQPPTTVTEVNERVELCLYSPLGLHGLL